MAKRKPSRPGKPSRPEKPSKGQTGLKMSNRHKESYVGAFKSWLGVKNSAAYGNYYDNMKMIDADSYVRERTNKTNRKDKSE